MLFSVVDEEEYIQHWTERIGDDIEETIELESVEEKIEKFGI